MKYNWESYMGYNPLLLNTFRSQSRKVVNDYMIIIILLVLLLEGNSQKRINLSSYRYGEE